MRQFGVALVCLSLAACGQRSASPHPAGLTPDEAGFTALPTAAYGIVLACASVSYIILQRQIIAVNGHDSRLAVALGSDSKGKLSLALYLAAIPLAFARPWIAIVLYVTVALTWLVPDTRIEALVNKGTREGTRNG